MQNLKTNKMQKTLFYAVNGSGCGCVFTDKPERDEHFKVWKGEIIGLFCSLVMQFEAEGLLSLPALRWNDEPIELTVTVSLI